MNFKKYRQVLLNKQPCTLELLMLYILYKEGALNKQTELLTPDQISDLKNFKIKNNEYQGILIIGSPYDKKQPENIAENFGLYNNVIWHHIIHRIKYDLTHDRQIELSISALIQKMMQQGKLIEEVFDWFSEIIDALYLEQLPFAQAINEIFEKGTIEEFSSSKGDSVLIKIKTDNPDIAKAAFSKMGPKADIIVFADSKNYVKIISSKGSKLDLKCLAITLRTIELISLKKFSTNITKKLLANSGSIAETPNIFYAIATHNQGQRILNGGKKFKGNIKPISTDIDAICEIIKKIRPQCFSKNNCAEKCTDHNCPINIMISEIK